MCEATSFNDVRSVRASIDSLIRQVNKKYPGSIITAQQMLTRNTKCSDETLSASERNSKPTVRSGHYR